MVLPEFARNQQEYLRKLLKIAVNNRILPVGSVFPVLREAATPQRAALTPIRLEPTTPEPFQLSQPRKRPAPLSASAPLSSSMPPVHARPRGRSPVRATRLPPPTPITLEGKDDGSNKPQQESSSHVPRITRQRASTASSQDIAPPPTIVRLSENFVPRCATVPTKLSSATRARSATPDPCRRKFKRVTKSFVPRCAFRMLQAKSLADAVTGEHCTAPRRSVPRHWVPRCAIAASRTESEVPTLPPSPQRQTGTVSSPKLLPRSQPVERRQPFFSAGGFGLCVVGLQ